MELELVGRLRAVGVVAVRGCMQVELFQMKRVGGQGSFIAYFFEGADAATFTAIVEAGLAV